MKNGTCPKCEAHEVRLVKESVVELAVHLSWSKVAQVGQYICTNCGYTEYLVNDENLLPKIAEKYQKIIPQSEENILSYEKRNLSEM